VTSPTAVALACAREVIEVDRSIAEMSTERVHWRRFVVAPSGAPPALRILRRARLEGQVIEGPLGRCVIDLQGDALAVQVADGPFLGELVLRLAWYLVTARLGGVLLHAAAIESDGAALVACGKSGDGKSTLSRLCRGEGLRLLTDEVVQVFPDGRVGGTPFRSDEDNDGSPGLAPARFFCALRKAGDEALEPLSATEAVQLALGQCFTIDQVAVPRVETRRRLLAFLGAVQLRTLAFRKDPEAGAFVRRVLASDAR
jgi:hypothetical protein